MSKSSKPVPPLHALLGDSQVPVVQAAEGEVQFIKGFRSDLPFAHALTEDGKAIMPVVKVLGAGDGPGPGGGSIEQGDGIKIASVGDKKVISTAVPISTSGPTGKHRHWRWDFPATITEGTFVRVDRIRAIGSDNANIPLNGRTVTSSGSQSAYPASDAFRVDENSGWHWRSSGTAPAWIAIDVGSGNEVQVASTRLFVATAAAGGRPASVQLSYSDDGVTWTKVGEAALAYEGAWSSSVLAGEGQVPLFIGEAPGDGKAYTRKDGGWSEAVVPDELTVDAGGGIEVDTSVPGKATVSTLVPISRKGPPGKHRFWRWTFPANYGDDQFRLQKLRMFDGAGQRIELDATNTTVTASNQDGGNSASNAIYNAATGFWATARFVTFPVWVATEFTTPMEVTSVTLARNETLTNTRPRSLMVEFSDDGVVWTQALGVTTLTWAGGDTAAVPMGDTDIPAFPPYPPKDGNNYVMKDDEWVVLPEQGEDASLPEAPEDGKLYGRKDKGWAEVALPAEGTFVKVEDLPPEDDGKLYGMRDRQWEVLPSAGNPQVHEDEYVVPSDMDPADTHTFSLPSEAKEVTMVMEVPAQSAQCNPFIRLNGVETNSYGYRRMAAGAAAVVTDAPENQGSFVLGFLLAGLNNNPLSIQIVAKKIMGHVAIEWTLCAGSGEITHGSGKITITEGVTSITLGSNAGGGFPQGTKVRVSHKPIA